MNRATPKSLRIWQQNTNKSLMSQLHLLNTATPSDYDILLLQEPWLSHTKMARSTFHWRALYPDTHYSNSSKPLRSIIFINTNIPTNCYKQICLNSPDVTGIRLKIDRHTLIIVNVYNDCNNNDSINKVSNFLSNKFPSQHIPDDTHVILASDFNRHHPLWEDKHNVHLTSSRATLHPILKIVDDYGFRMALPPRILTLQALATGNWTHPDNVWCTGHSTDLFTKCDTDPGLRGPTTDHLPILSMLDFPLLRTPPKPSRNFRATDWTEFNETLKTLLRCYPAPTFIKSKRQFRTALDAINTSISPLTWRSQLPNPSPTPNDGGPTSCQNSAKRKTDSLGCHIAGGASCLTPVTTSTKRQQGNMLT